MQQQLDNVNSSQAVLKPSLSFLTLLTLLLVPISWGGAFITAKIAVAELAPMTAAFLRFSIASLCLFPILLYKEGKTAKAQKEDLPWLMLLGLTGIFGYNIFFFYGLKYTSAINGSLIVASNPGITVVLAALILKERLKLAQILGLIISFIGVIFVISKGSLQTIAQLEFNKGDFIFLGATITWALYSIAGKRVMLKYSALAATTYAILFGTLFLAPFAIKDLSTLDWSQVSVSVWLAILFMGVVSSAISFVWWYRGVNQLGASKTAIFINLVPVSVMVITAFLGEVVTVIEILGAMLVIGGVYITTVKKG